MREIDNDQSKDCQRYADDKEQPDRLRRRCEIGRHTQEAGCEGHRDEDGGEEC